MKPTTITQIAAGIHQIAVGAALIFCGDASRRVRRIEL